MGCREGEVKDIGFTKLGFFWRLHGLSRSWLWGDRRLCGQGKLDKGESPVVFLCKNTRTTIPSLDSQLIMPLKWQIRGSESQFKMSFKENFVPAKSYPVGGFYSKNLGSSSQGHLVAFYPNLANRKECIRRGEPLVVTSVLGKKATTGRETVVPDPDYRIPIVLLGFAGGLVYSNNLLSAAPVGLLGLLLLFQTTRVKFVFDDEALEVKIGEELQESGENVFVGGKNRWKYSTFVNWELWWPNFPILVYFKETQTKPEGQVHFFPVIFNGKQLYDVMVERAGPSKTSGPKPS